MKKLNFGCGSIQPKDWVNVDSDPAFQALTTTGYFSSSEFDMIVAHCSLQMNDWHDLPEVLSELHQILKPGGVLRISLPDIIKGLQARMNGDINWFPNGEPEIDTRFSAWLTWYSTTRTLLTQNALYGLLKQAGFSEVVETKYKQTVLSSHEITELDTRDGECYFVEARK